MINIMNPLIAENEEFLTKLQQHGFVVLPVLFGDKFREFSEWFEEAVLSAPELRQRVEPGTKIVLGEVAYLPFASVWNAPEVRGFMRLVYCTTFDNVFSGMVPALEMSMSPDRAMYRVPGQATNNISKKKWHRDAAPNAIPGYLIFGG